MLFMAHAPQHPHNPCSLDENQQTPAKIWELLRHNERFGRAVRKLQSHDATEKANRVYGPFRTSCRVVDALKKHHEFAANALQWLVPEPEFLVWHVAVPKKWDSAGRFELDIVAEGRGMTPDPNDQANWSWETRIKGQPRGAVGESFRRGPIVFRQTCDDPRFCSKVDPLQEWREFFEVNKRNFTQETPWREAPPGFRRDFCWLWRQRDSRAVSPDTGLRHDAPEPHETDFFQNWLLGKALVSGCKTGQIDSEDFARIFQFDDLASDYRVFAFPKIIRTRMEARRLAAWLKEKLYRLPDGTELPKRESDVLGSPLLWDMLLVYEDRRNKGDEHLAALRYTFDNLYLRLPTARLHAEAPTERSLDAVFQHRVAEKVLAEAESTRWHSWQDDFARIHSPTSGQGLVQLIFPSLQAAIAKSASPSAT
jgi:hypothetical protein